MQTIHLYDAVALLVDLPDEHLYRGHVGTVIEELGPDVYEIEFSDATNGQTYAMLPISGNLLMPLRFAPVQAA